MKQKLDSKIQALLIISRELEQCRNERDHYKAMIEQLKPDQSINECDKFKFLVQHLCDSQERDKTFQIEIQDLKLKLLDANGDIKLLREQLATKQHIDEPSDTIHVRHHSISERKALVDQLESLKVKYILLEKDLQTILDEKEELITERDAYKQKVCRLNHELNIALKGDEKTIVDIDAILMENRYLQERLKQTQEEKSLYLQTLSKYKSMLEKRRNKTALKFGGPGSGNVIITHKQVEQMLQNTSLSQLPATQATVADLRSLALALFDSLNDKNIALSHQKKANKILGSRLSLLEKKIAFLEISANQDDNECHDENKEKCNDEASGIFDITTTDLTNTNVKYKEIVSKRSSGIEKELRISNSNEDNNIIVSQFRTASAENISIESNDESFSQCSVKELYIIGAATTEKSISDVDDFQKGTEILSSDSIHGQSSAFPDELPNANNVNNDMTPELQKLVFDALQEIKSEQVQHCHASKE